MSTKPFFTALLGILGIGLTIVASVNYGVDVSGVYKSSSSAFQDFVRVYVERLRDSPSGLVKPPLSERHIKYALARRYEADCYIIGSSHEMTSNLDRLPNLAAHCGSVLNLAVAGGGFEDALIMLNTLADRTTDKLIVLGISPWLFKRNADARWQELGDAYPEARARLLSDRTAVTKNNGKLKNLINGEYFVRNLQSLMVKEDETVTTTSAAIISATAAREDAILGQDGSLTYSRAFIEKSHPRTESTSCSDYKVSQPFIQEAALADFERALKVLLANGKRFAFILNPYHPGIFKCNIETPAALRATEEVTRQLGERLGIPVWGGFHPARHGLTGADFYDYMHVDADSLHKVRTAE